MYAQVLLSNGSGSHSSRAQERIIPAPHYALCPRTSSPFSPAPMNAAGDALLLLIPRGLKVSHRLGARNQYLVFTTSCSTTVTWGYRTGEVRLGSSLTDSKKCAAHRTYMQRQELPARQAGRLAGGSAYSQADHHAFLVANPLCSRRRLRFSATAGFPTPGK